jgi:chemotaxis signal transduction protein
MSALTRVESSAVAAAAAVSTRELLTFKLGTEEYGIDILKVQEIRSYENPTRIANAPRLHQGGGQPPRGDRADHRPADEVRAR